MSLTFPPTIKRHNNGVYFTIVSTFFFFILESPPICLKSVMKQLKKSTKKWFTYSFFVTFFLIKICTLFFN